MQQHTSLYRRHRPRSFEDVVGQQHVVQTLKNAIELGQVHHAYLFVGSRGTGKTSLAKILAAALNCEQGPTVTPCGQCEACLGIAEARSIDVVEMDAASNNSVDDIRALRDQVVYAPVNGKHKVYILDEAHMLSKQAWNAFLKTLEEPPPRTVFVLATTEADKVLATVADRCHRFDFTRPSVQQLANVIERVAVTERFTIDAEAVRLTAKQAHGSFRDALGLLEQLVAYAGTTITSKEVASLLGLADFDLLYELFDAVGFTNPITVFTGIERAIAAGHEPESLLKDLEEYARVLLLAAFLNEVPAELSVSQERDHRLQEQAQRVGTATITYLLDLIAEALMAIRSGADPRIRLEMALTKATVPQLDPTLSAVLARVGKLETGRVSQTFEDSRVPQKVEVAPATEGEPEDQGAAMFVDEIPVDVFESMSSQTLQAAQAPQEQPPSIAETNSSADSKFLPGEVVDTSEGIDLAGLQRVWPTVLACVREKNALLAALIEKAHPAQLVDDTLELTFAPKDDFVCRKASQETHTATLTEAIFETLKQRLRLQYRVSETQPDEGMVNQVAQESLTEDEVTAQFIAAFNGKEISTEENI